MTKIVKVAKTGYHITLAGLVKADEYYIVSKDEKGVITLKPVITEV